MEKDKLYFGELINQVFEYNNQFWLKTGFDKAINLFTELEKKFDQFDIIDYVLYKCA